MFTKNKTNQEFIKLVSTPFYSNKEELKKDLEIFEKHFLPGDYKRACDMLKNSLIMNPNSGYKKIPVTSLRESQLVELNTMFSLCLLAFSSKPFHDYAHCYSLNAISDLLKGRRRKSSKFPLPHKGIDDDEFLRFKGSQRECTQNEKLYEYIITKYQLLSFAALAGNTSLVQFLIEQGGIHAKEPLATRYQYFDANVSSKVFWIYELAPANLLTFSVLSGNLETVKLIESHFSISSKCYMNALHHAAVYGHLDICESLIESGSGLLQKDEQGNTFFHILSLAQKKETFVYFLRRFPREASACWKIRNNKGELLIDVYQSVYQNNIEKSPAQWLHEELVRTTQMIASGQSEDELNSTLTFLDFFSEEWRVCLFRPNLEHAAYSLSEQPELFSGFEKLKHIICAIKDVQNLQRTITFDRPLTYSCFNHLLDLARKANKTDTYSPGHFPFSQKKLLKKLFKCFQRLPAGKEELSPEAIRTINVIINDYEREPLTDGLEKSCNQILIYKLLQTSSLSALRPRLTTESGKEINATNYHDHLETMKETFETLPVSDEVRRIINNIFFKGLQHLIEHQAEIVDHVAQRYGVMYYLVPGDKILLSLPPENIQKGNFYFYLKNHEIYYSGITGSGTREELLCSFPEPIKQSIQSEINLGKEKLQDEMLKEAIADELIQSGLPFEKKQLPLHTDHVDRNSPEKFQNTIDKLLINIMGAFYCCKLSGELPEFFNQLSHGNCLEARVESTLTWAASFNEMRTFSELMEKWNLDYVAYSKIMKKASDEDVGNIQSATKFIIKRHHGVVCATDEQYAPNNKITEDGVRRFFSDILAYERSSQQCTIM